MTKIATLLREAADRADAVVDGIRDDQLGDPTPCAEFTVRDLVNHLYQVVVNFQSLAQRQKVDFSNTPDATADPQWRKGFAAETGKLAEAWSDPSALAGVSPGMGLPQPVVGQMILLDLVLHPWDLARATGQAYAPDMDAVSELHAFADHMGPTARQMKVFGPEHPVPDDAGEFERLLAKAGRDPQWTSGSR